MGWSFSFQIPGRDELVGIVSYADRFTRTCNRGPRRPGKSGNPGRRRGTNKVEGNHNYLQNRSLRRYKVVYKKRGKGEKFAWPGLERFREMVKEFNTQPAGSSLPDPRRFTRALLQNRSDRWIDRDHRDGSREGEPGWWGVSSW